jgi:hypothetical protein
MEKQTFAQQLWLALLPSLVSLTAIKGFDVWLLRQAHRTNRASVSNRYGGVLRRGKSNMLDAEIAATLLNRWDRKRACPGGQPPLELLREGRLHFRHEGGDVHADDTPADRRLRVECLTFTDGSRALRVTDADGQSGWTRWTAAEPVSKRQTNPRTDHVDIA